MLKRLQNIRWKRIFLITTWLDCLSGLVVLMSFISVKSNDFACTDLRVIIPGEQSFIARDDVDRLLDQKHGKMVGRTLSTLPIHAIEQDLQAIPFVEKAMVSMDMNGVLTIRLKQREAVIRIINAIGEDFYIDKHAVKMPLSSHYAPKVLVANGDIRELYGKHLDSIESPKVQELYRTAKFIQSDSLWRDQIEQLFVNRDQEIEMVPLVGDHQIILGNADSLQLKFSKLMWFYKHIIPTVGWDAYKAVNLSFANQLVCIRNENYKENSLNQQ